MEIQGDQEINYSLSRMFVFEQWIDATKDNNAEKCKYVIQQLSKPFLEKNMNTQNLEKRCRYLCKKLWEYYKKASQNKKVLLNRHSDWLNVRENIVLTRFQEKKTANVDNHETIAVAVAGTKRQRGRPKKSFSECCERSKRRRLMELSKLDESLIVSLNKNDAENVTKEINVDEILSLIVEAKLTKHQYILIEKLINSKASNSVSVSLPSYAKVLKAKKKCYPKQEEIKVTESSAEIELQSLLDHTASRIIESQKPVMDTISIKSSHKFILIGKWGFDGTTGQSKYKQNFTDRSGNDEDGSLFITSYVPLRLVMRDVDNSDIETVIWKNPRPASTRYCRPVRFKFEKETKVLSQQEENYIQDKINSLRPSLVSVNGKNNIVIEHFLQLTMIDGKVCSALCDMSVARCFICGATPKEMNDIEKCLQKSVHEENYEYGLSTLHAWIRFYEYFLHVSYRLPLQKWQMRSKEEKCCFLERKKLIQTLFRQKLGLIVDKPQSGGSGSTNDGNTARAFFDNPRITAEITGLNEDLIYRCSVILKVLASGHRINTKKFEEYAKETAKRLVTEYPWYYLPASVHKVLIHGSEVIEYALLPIGEMSEEAAEAKNKDVKYIRQHNTRKQSRVMSNTDLLNRLLLTSDPFITGLRSLPQKKKGSLPKDCVSLILEQT